MFATQEEDRDRYRRNVDCTFNYRMNRDTCSKLSFECEEFRLNRGDYLSITTGTQTTTYKWRNRGEIILQEFSGDISVRFKSDGSRQGPGAYCWMWCSEEGSAPSTTGNPSPSTTASTTSTTTSPSTSPPSTTTTESPVTTSSSGLVSSLYVQSHNIKVMHPFLPQLNTSMSKPYSIKMSHGIGGRRWNSTEK